MKTKKAQPVPPTYTVQNCTFTSQPLAMDAKLADSVLAVAKALLNLTETFKSSGVTAPMIRIGPEK